MKDFSGVLLFPNEKIQISVGRIAHSAVRWLEAGGNSPVVLVSVLEGARPFTRDLLRAMTALAPKIPMEIQEVRVKGTEGTGLLDNREWRGVPLRAESVRGKRVLVVDDLVDSGKTLEMLRGGLQSLGLEEIKTAVLIRKFGDQSGPVDFCGFELNLDRKALALKGLKDYWLFGYGMDLDGQFRELDYIGWVEIHEDKTVQPPMNTDE